MSKEERWVLAVCMTILMGTAFSVSLHSIVLGICLGVCMGVAFGLFDSAEDDTDGKDR